MGVSLCKVHLTNRTSILLNKSCDLGNISIYTTRIMRYSIQNNCDSDLNIHLGPQINTRDVNNLNTKTIGIFIGNCNCSPQSALHLKIFLFLGLVFVTVGFALYLIDWIKKDQPMYITTSEATTTTTTIAPCTAANITSTTGMIFYEAFTILTDGMEF